MIYKPFEMIYHLASRTKNFLYDQKLKKSEQLQVPVVSIGNLSFGGTGKTPFIEFLAKQFQDRRIVVVCRSYKASLSSSQKVDLTIKEAAEVFGDEAVLLQKKLPSCSVWSGPQKWKTARAAMSEKPDLIFIDDGFSHRQLKRDFDLILFDANKLENDYFREGFASLKRAHAVVLTKTENANLSQLDLFQKKLEKKFPHLVGSIYCSETKSEFHLAPGTPVFAFCGIAKPDSFLRSLQNQKYNVVHFEDLADHQSYPALFQEKIWTDYNENLKKFSNLRILTTEKDFNKITHPELRKNVGVVDYVVVMDNKQKENLIEKIRQRTQL